MKDNNDTVTFDSFDAESKAALEELERPVFVQEALAAGGHYQAVRILPEMVVSGNRYAGSKTPDSIRDYWATDRSIIEAMEARYGKYDLDAAASAENAVCEKFYDEKTNCLKRWWGKGKHIWLNPPYSTPLPFIEKAVEQMEHENQIDVLLPGDASTVWFAWAQKYAAEIIWIIADVDTEQRTCRGGRISFIHGDTGKPVSGNNKGSVIAIMRKLKEGEVQQTHYLPISEICPSVKSRKMRKIGE